MSAGDGWGIVLFLGVAVLALREIIEWLNTRGEE